MLSNSLNDASEEIIELKALKLYSVFFIFFLFFVSDAKIQDTCAKQRHNK